MEQHHNPFASKAARLLLILGVFFVTNALLAELIGVKIFALEDSFGWKPFNWNLFGEKGSLNFTVGVILWPFVFIMTDIINEYFGLKGVRRLSYLAIIFIIYAFGIIYLAIELSPAGFWPASNVDKGVPDMQNAYAVIFGQGMWIIAGSIVAFLLGQLIDVFIFHKIKFCLVFKVRLLYLCAPEKPDVVYDKKSGESFSLKFSITTWQLNYASNAKVAPKHLFTTL